MASDHARGDESIPPAELERAAQLFRVMGDGSRLRIPDLLKKGEICVTEVVAAVNEGRKGEGEKTL